MSVSSRCLARQSRADCNEPASSGSTARSEWPWPRVPCTRLANAPLEQFKWNTRVNDPAQIRATTKQSCCEAHCGGRPQCAAASGSACGPSPLPDPSWSLLTNTTIHSAEILSGRRLARKREQGPTFVHENLNELVRIQNLAVLDLTYTDAQRIDEWLRAERIEGHSRHRNGAGCPANVLPRR